MPLETDDTIENALLGPVLAGRTCGDCTVCCTALTVDTPEFSKPAGTACVHVCADGCAIHAVRPRICRTWFCAWRRVAAMPDAARPDRSGLLVLVEFEREPRNCLEGVAITVRKLAGSTAIEDGTAAAVLDSLCDRLVPVWFSDGARKMLMHPDAEVAGLILSGAAPPDHLRDEVRAWRDRYGQFDPRDRRPAAGRGS